jgi:hypothetical protein
VPSPPLAFSHLEPVKIVPNAFLSPMTACESSPAQVGVRPQLFIRHCLQASPFTIEIEAFAWGRFLAYFFFLIGQASHFLCVSFPKNSVPHFVHSLRCSSSASLTITLARWIFGKKGLSAGIGQFYHKF